MSARHLPISSLLMVAVSCGVALGPPTVAGGADAVGAWGAGGAVRGATSDALSAMMSGAVSEASSAAMSESSGAPSGSADSVDDGEGLVLGPTLLLSGSGELTTVPERDALRLPWTATPSDIAVGSHGACAVVWPLAREPHTIAQALWLSDGQCLPGSPDPDGAPSPGRVRWRSGDLVLDVPLTEVRAWTAVGVPAPRGSVDADRVVLRNGDAVDGIVTALGSRVVMDANGVEREFDAELVASVHFVQVTERRPQQRRLRVWIDDGSVLDVDELVRDGAVVRLALPGRGEGEKAILRVRVDQLLGAATPRVECSGVMIRQAASNAPALPGLDPRTSVTGPGRLGAMGATLRGEGVWSILVPSAGTLVFGVSIPEHARAVASHGLVVRQGGVVLATFRARDQARAERIPVQAGALELELVAGRAGPIGCVVELSDLVFVASLATDGPPTTAPSLDGH